MSRKRALGRSKNNWSKDVALIYPTFDRKSIKRYHHIGSCLRVKRLHSVKEAWKQPIFNNIANSPSLHTRSKALVRSMKAIYEGMLYSLHFSLTAVKQRKSYSGGALKCKSTLRFGTYSFYQLL